ncbi:MAG: type II toxin-antitoxin system prevent-host-death family antitoxin [bacterium]|jgi:prevent-host-death family protein|nr:type II toxin-antitoxin system prevent-host-death family antitoxin [bacterium]
MAECQNSFSEIIAMVNEGNEFIITQRGIPVARLIPVGKILQEAVKTALERAKQLRETLSLKGLKIRDLIEDGRK